MSWVCVTAIKNANNELSFVAVPVDNLVISGTYTNYSFSGTRGSVPADFALANVALDLALQDINDGAKNFYVQGGSQTSGTYYITVFGKSAGKAIVFKCTLGVYTNRVDYSLQFQRYTSLGSYTQVGSESGSLSLANFMGKQYLAVGFVINEAEEKIYPCRISGGFYYGHSSHLENYYDQASYQLHVCNDSNSNLWDLLFDSIPSGGGGADPYADGGYSTGTDTGTGTFDDSSESVSLPTTYAYSATAAGLISQYVVTEAELRTFGAWLWYGGSIIDDLKHFFQSPMEAIFSVGMLPFTPSDTTNYNIYVGSLDANTTGKLVNDTVEKISMGSITFDGYYGSALDFNPYTKIEIFLPYCGNFALNPDEVMGHTISVDYYCDSVSGDCVAFVSDEDRVLYQVKGNCFVQIPLAARDFTAQYASAIGAVGTVAAGLAASVASGGMSAPIAVGMGTSMASNAMNAKAHIARAGGVSGMAGFMSIQNPYVIITIPNQCLPEFQAEHQGYPLFVTKALKEFSGFTKVYEIHLDGLDCTDAEAKEIYDLLKGGVIL